MHTVKLKIEDNIYANVMFLLKNLKLKGLDIKEESIPEISTQQKIKDLFKMKQIDVFEDIADPMQWQRTQRDEW